MQRKYCCCIFRSLHFLSRLLKECDHHVRASSGISVTRWRRYKQLMSLWSTDLPSHDGSSDGLNTWSLTKVCISLSTCTEFPSGKYWSHPPQAAWQDQAGSQALSFGFPLSPRSRTPRSRREERAKHSSSILSELGAAGAAPWKHGQNTKYLLEMISMPISTILGKNWSPLPPEQSCTYSKICFSAVFTSVILHFFLLLFTVSVDG